MKEHWPALHVAFYRCIWVLERVSLRLGRLEERMVVRLRTAASSRSRRLAHTPHPVAEPKAAPADEFAR